MNLTKKEKLQLIFNQEKIGTEIEATDYFCLAAICAMLFGISIGVTGIILFSIVFSIIGTIISSLFAVQRVNLYMSVFHWDSEMYLNKYVIREVE